MDALAEAVRGRDIPGEAEAEAGPEDVVMTTGAIQTGIVEENATKEF